MVRVRESLKQNELGSAAVEFALAIPLFLMLFFAAVDIFRLLLAEEQLNRVARGLAFHYKYVAATDRNIALKQQEVEATARNLAVSSGASLISSRTISVSTKIYGSLSAYASGMPDSGPTATWQPGQLVHYYLSSSVDLTSPLMMAIHGRSVAPIRAISMVKNGS